MNAISRSASASALVPEQHSNDVRRALQTSLYPGAADASVDLVLSYCKAAHLDPMTKPVHIVPMWDSKARTMRDVVMPGIGLYRTIAARTGCAGISEPDFGPDVAANIGGVDIVYPQWCRVTVRRRLESGDIVEFTARELWMENYAVKGGQEKSIAPNAMWSKRPYGQIAKCAEAQALRKAFPEVGAQPTAEEMEGKAIEGEVSAPAKVEVTQTTQRGQDEYPQADFDANLPKWEKAIATRKKTPEEIIALVESKGRLSQSQRDAIHNLVKPDQQPVGATEEGAQA